MESGRATLGGPGKSWQQALTLTVLDTEGVVQPWPFAAQTSAMATRSIEITDSIGGGRSFKLTAAQVAALKPGSYELRGSLDLRTAGGGFIGWIFASTTLDVGQAAVSARSAVVDVAAIATKLLTKTGTLQRAG